METEKLYYADPFLKEFTATVLTCEPGKAGYLVTLDRTAFYPEGGGQPADHGTLNGVAVTDVHETDGVVVHTVEKAVEIGENVDCTIDWARRFDHMQQHSGEHIVSGMLCAAFSCDNVGFHMGEDAVILDFDKELSPAQLREIENQANAIITENRPVTACYPSQAELAALDYRSKLDLTENVRIVTIQGCDVCACCAPHVKHTGEIGLVKLLDAMRHRGGIRIWMAAGKMALADYQVKQENIAAISAALSVQQPQAAQGVQRILGEMEGLKEALKAARQALVLEKAKALPETQGNLCLFEADLDAGSLRALANAGMEKCTGICAVFTGDDQTGYRYVMGSRTVDLRAQAKAINTALGGKGGGQPTMIQGSVTAGQAAILAYFQ